MAVSPPLISVKKALQWDVATWSRALSFWEKQAIPALPNDAFGLEIGACRGGLTAYFAQKGFRMISSDLVPFSTETKLFHEALQLKHPVEYHVFSATAIPFPDGIFDFVVFKSVLGAVGHDDQVELQQKAVLEMHRVLKPGGTLFFAENQQGSALHRFARQNFIPWGKSWRYVTASEMKLFLKPFVRVQIRSTGFWAAFIPKPEWLKNIFAAIDQLCPFIPPNWRYVVYGCAQKQEVVYLSRPEIGLQK